MVQLYLTINCSQIWASGSSPKASHRLLFFRHIIRLVRYSDPSVDKITL